LVAESFTIALAPVAILENASVVPTVGAVALRKRTDARDEAPLNALFPMDVTPAGMVMLVRDVARKNAPSLIDVIALPAAKVMLVRAAAANA
jgi:hypothetical protein